MKREKIICIFSIIYIFLSSASFQQFRDERGRNPRPSFSHQDTKFLNKGLLHRSKGERYAPDQILIKFKPSLSEQKIKATIAAYQTKKIKRIPRLNIYQLQIPKDMTVEEMIFLLSQNPDVEYAEPNYIAYITVTPNDTFFQYQYALHNSGQRVAPVSIPGAPTGSQKADIKATVAWEETKGEEEIIIAILDTGTDLNHPDIENKIQSSGRDFVNDDFDATDDHGHGTYVAGIAAADTNNNEGIAGVTWNCKILPVKVIDENGEGYYSWIIDGIVWAVDHEADVINLSLGGEVPTIGLEDAVRYAFENNVVISAASGNEGTAVLYPAAYDDYCLAVAASDYDDSRPDWSNFGPEVDVAAPGDWILSLWPEDLTPAGYLPYIWSGGTSASTPHVAGFAALIKSIKPWLTASEIIDIICYSADDINSVEYPGKDEFVGYGRINMEKALVPIKITASK